MLDLDERPFVVAFGGSLGAAKLNDAVTNFLNQHDTSHFQFLLGTGQRYYDTVQKKLQKQRDSVRILPYIDRMDLVMAAADAVIGRAGALTVSELCALGKPSVLIPSPNVAHDHQTYNAKNLEDAGAAILLPETELSGDTLLQAIHTIISHPEQITKMGACAKKIGITDGTARICEVVCSLSPSKE